MRLDYIPTEAEIAKAYALRYISADDQLLSELFNLIESQFKNAHDPKFYARKLGISYRHLSRLTCAKLGKTPNQCLQLRLHEEAERLLKYTDKSVKEITFELGICDTSHFCRCFKKITGQSPGEFRRSYESNRVTN